MIYTDTFESSSSDKTYTATYDTETGEAACTFDCPGWRNSGAKRQCKHSKAMLAKYGGNGAAPAAQAKAKKERAAAISTEPFIAPQLAQSGQDAPLQGPNLAYEPKYDGIRAVVCGDGKNVTIYARSGADKTVSFPEIAAALTKLTHKVGRFVLDGEIVAVDKDGRPTNFQKMQARMGVTVNVESAVKSQACRFIAFDLIKCNGFESLQFKPWGQRRLVLQELLGRLQHEFYAPADVALRDGREMHELAKREGWEGLIVKDVNSRYSPGKRGADWRKLKFLTRQEFVIGGFTEPRRSRPYFGSIIIGVYEKGKLVCCGQAGTGFTHAQLAKVHKQLLEIETDVCPFETKPKTDEKAHWVKPLLMAEIEYAECTEDGMLRFPSFKGLRDSDEKDPRTVVWEQRPKFNK